jgi:small subunit ribosomal protein S5
MAPQRRGRPDAADSGLNERVVYTRRIAKVVKGGRHLRFNALVVVGDGEGQVGVGMGKATAIPDAVRKGNAIAKKGMIHIPLKGSTIPQECSSRKGAAIVLIKPAPVGTGLIAAGAAIVLIKPAPVGTGLIAAGAVRAVLDLAGVKDVVAKSLGSRNPINVVQATLQALRQLKNPEEEIARRTGRRPRQEVPAAATPQEEPSEG